MASEPAEELTTEGSAALEEGDWARARACFEAALAAGDDRPEVLDGLGQALWWLNDLDDAIAHRERACAAFRRSGRHREAAQVALWLSWEYLSVHESPAAQAGWLHRAERP